MKREQVEFLEVDVDRRLGELRKELLAEDLDDENMTVVASYLRAAYACGYVDGHSENGNLFRDNGYEVPKRTVA